MRARWLLLLGILIALGWALASWSEEDDSTPPNHGEAPSLQCFSCHGPHPPRNAEEIDLAEFALPLHAPSAGPTLTCASCHTYPEELEEITPNSCVGCHERGGYPIAEVLDSLAADGHPDVKPMIREVPRDCSLCHQGDGMKLGPRLHRRHLFASAKFMLHFQTGCANCHIMNENGEPTIESYPLK